jgi:thymidine kinase
MLSIFLGPMFSGKTSSLMTEINKNINKDKCIIIKYIKDLRYGKEILVSHDKLKISDVKVILTSDLNNIVNEILNYDNIFIDEGQFIDNLNITIEWADNGKKVFIAYLDGDYKRNPFTKNNLSELISMADNVYKCKAYCNECHADAIYTYRKKECNGIENIGGSELYAPLCRKCYLKLGKH